MFSIFSNASATILKELFMPPHGLWLYSQFFYEPLVLSILLILLLLPFPVAGVSWLWNWLRSWFNSAINRGLRGSARDWRPWSFSYTYLLFINVVTMCLITLSITLFWRSEQPDPLVERASPAMFFYPIFN